MSFIVATQSPTLNVRSGPGESFQIVGKLHRGATVEVSGAQGVWRRLATGGWVAGRFLRSRQPAPNRTPADPNFILPHPNRPTALGWKILAAFDTGRADLKPAHRAWLMQFVVPRVRYGHWVFLRGFASRVGDGPGNQDLSNRRAEAVRDFLVNQAGVRPDKITGFGGVGERWSTGTGNDNSPRWRAVEVIVSSGVIQLPGGDPIYGESPAGRNFFIKYFGGGGAGALEANLFIIRNRVNWWQQYFFVGAGGGVSTPSFGTQKPRGQGWVPFTVSTTRTVDSFEGRAEIVQAGAQVGPVGLGTFQLMLPAVGRLLAIPTGPGLGAGISGTIGRFQTAEPPMHTRFWDL